MAEDNYIPFGEEWEKEIMKMNKKFIIGLYRTAAIKQQQSRDTLKHIAQFSDVGNDAYAISTMKQLASSALK